MAADLPIARFFSFSLFFFFFTGIYRRLARFRARARDSKASIPPTCPAAPCVTLSLPTCPTLRHTKCNAPHLLHRVDQQRVIVHFPAVGLYKVSADVAMGGGLVVATRLKRKHFDPPIRRAFDVALSPLEFSSPVKRDIDFDCIIDSFHFIPSPPAFFSHAAHITRLRKRGII